MEKEALLSIILNDIKEVETLVQSFKGKDQIMPAFLKLTIQKIDNIKQEMELLGCLEPPKEQQPVKQIITQGTTPQQEASPVIVPSQSEAKPVVIAPPAPVKAETLLEMEPLVPHIETPPVKVVAEPSVEKHEPKLLSEEAITAHHHAKIHADDTHFPAPQHKHNVTLGEVLESDKTSLNDMLHTSKETINPAITGAHVEDIRKAIGINDRFLFQRELFENNNTLMNQTIDELNKLNTFAEAQAFIKSNFNWDAEDDTVAGFYAVVRRKF